jgi:DNA topoisomerase-1
MMTELYLDKDPEAAANRAGLHYTGDEEPGYQRKRWGRGFTYFDPEGTRVRDDELRQRFESMAIPPAWTEVWICADPRGHLQVTGRDEAGRRQYIYHPIWEEVRQQTKFNRMLLL